MVLGVLDNILFNQTISLDDKEVSDFYSVISIHISTSQS